MGPENEDIMIPLDVLHDRSLAAAARMVYGVILAMSMPAGYCIPTNKELAARVLRSERRVSDYLTALESREYIRREIAFGGADLGEAMVRRLIIPRPEDVTEAGKIQMERGNEHE